jgi:hypothetical protein
MRIGISVLSQEGQNIWSNGLGQNVIFLAQVFRQIPFITEVILVDTGSEGVMPPQVDLTKHGLSLMRPNEAFSRLDAIVEMAGALPVAWLDRFRACGKKVVYYCAGQPYASMIEPVIFTDKGFSHRPDRMDEIWMLPKDYPDFAPMMRTMHRCPVHEVPYLWSPLFLSQRAEELASEGHAFGYRPRPAQDGRPASFRAAIFEPNISVVKSSSIPMLVCDEAARIEPQVLDKMHVLNTLHLKDHPTMLFFANSLDLVKAGKALFHGRNDFAGFMVQFADAVVSHQWQNDQNYSYLDALWGNYPLIHNSPWLREAGYYYPDFNAQAGAQQLLQAWQHHDAQLDAYRERSQRVFERIDPANPANVQTYAKRLLALFNGRLPAASAS